MSKSQIQRRNLLSAKVLFFTTAMCGVGWSRFQNNFYLDNGLSSREIGILKSVGLILKVAGEPFWSMVADLTDQKLVFGLCMVMQILTMEILRVSTPLTYNLIFFVKVLRTTTAPSATLTTTASFKLTEGSDEGYGQQRMFGSLAWGGGAFIAGYLIDTYGMNALFYYTYLFNFTSLIFVIFILPNSTSTSTSTLNSNINSNSNVNSNSTNSTPTNNHKSNIRSLIICPEEGGVPEKFTGLRCKSKSSDSLLECLPKEHSPNENSRYSIQRISRNFRQYFTGLFSYMSNVPCRAILFNSFLYGVVMTVPDTFLFVSLDVDFKASRTFSGMITSTSIIACLPLFWYSTTLIAKHGHYNLIFLAESSCVVRLLAYSLLSPSRKLSLYILPGIQLIHGLNFALYWSATVDAIYNLAPVELTTICIAALNVSYYTFGGAVGNILFGFVYDFYGGARCVYLCAVVLLLCTLGLLKSQQSIINNALLINRTHTTQSSTASSSTHSHTHTHVHIHPHTHQPCDRD